jgi:hypothetical protein
MSSFLNIFRRASARHPEFKAGIYHYQSPADDPRNYRLHLRVESNGEGVLIVNAATVLHLNETATEYLFYFVHNLPAQDVGLFMTSRYNVDRRQAEADYRGLAERVLTLVEVPDLDPVTFLDFERRQPYSGQIAAPYRLDIAPTYRLPQGEAPESAPVERVKAELSAAEWKHILEKAWQAGIPHVTFTGGEPTLRDDLPELVAQAERLGMVSGLVTNGERFAEASYLKALLDTGLDHVFIVMHPDHPHAWAALKNALPEDLFVAVHLTLTKENHAELPEYLQELKSLGVSAVSLTTTAPELKLELQGLRELLADLDLRLVWDIAVPYSSLNPVALEMANAKPPQGAGRAWLYVEPDGDVLPAQGVNMVLGNLLNDPWEKIWKQAQAYKG